MTSVSKSESSEINDPLAHDGHASDGILEYDNPLPGWWKNVFWISIFFSLFYLAYFHTGGPGRSIEERYQAALAENTRKQYAEIGDLEPNDTNVLKYMQEPKWVAVGGAIFKSNCVSCHGADGGGSVGPNLCDENYKHIKQVADIIRVINDGVAGGAMPAWGTRLGHKNDIVLVSAYVASLRGKTAANPKAPDGGPIPPWPISAP